MISQVCFFAIQQFTWHIQAVRELLGSVLRDKCQGSEFFRRRRRSRGQPLRHAYNCFDRGVQSVEGACCATQFCFPPCSFPQTYVPLLHENSISMKLCQIPRYSVLNNRFHFNWPIPRFRPQFCDRGNHRALHNSWLMTKLLRVLDSPKSLRSLLSFRAQEQW